MNARTIILITLAIILLSFSGIEKTIEFVYPKSKTAKITITTDKFKKFKEEWRGDDYYYISENGDDSIICSVLFYKLNKNEQKTMVDPTAMAHIIPLVYFMSNSNLKDYEKNKASWGDIKDDFMFRQNDVLEFGGVKVKQKNMFGYCMFDKDLFVNIHLSKVNYSPDDSIAMRKILEGLKKKK